MSEILLKTKTSLILQIVVLVIAFGESSLSNAGPFRHLKRSKPAMVRQRGDYKSSHYDRVREWNRYYPKYYGGFHARHFDTLGIPTGDIGLRGNGIYMMPW